MAAAPLSAPAALEYDERGWARGPVEPLPLVEAYSVFAPERDARIDGAAWSAHASRFFGVDLRLVVAKTYPAATLPMVDAAELDLRFPGDAASAAGESTRVVLVTVPLSRAAGAQRAAMNAAMAMGGAGMDALVAKATRLWQARATVEAGGDPRAPLAVAALLAAVLLGPVLPPEGGVLFGVKGARERLERLGAPARSPLHQS